MMLRRIIRAVYILSYNVLSYHVLSYNVLVETRAYAVIGRKTTLAFTTAVECSDCRYKDVDYYN